MTSFVHNVERQSGNKTIQGVDLILMVNCINAQNVEKH